MNIKIKLEPGAKMPHRSTEGAAAWDLFANLPEPITIFPGTYCAIPTGVSVALPKGQHWKIESKSGLSRKHGINVGGGVIDEDYRGEIWVILNHLGHEPYTIQPGEKIAQVILLKYEMQEFEIVDTLEATERGAGGFGSTGRV